MKILFVASEGLPFAKTGGLADVIGALPKALQDLGHEVAVFMPKYRRAEPTKAIIPSLTISLGATTRFPSLVEANPIGGVRYFFLQDPAYFERPELYQDKTGDYPDNPERFALFSHAALELAKQVWMPDVIHCHDWQSALVPVMLRNQYATDPLMRRLPVVFTVHNLGYQGVFPRASLARIGLPESLFRMDALEYYGKLNFMKGGLIFSDYLSTVSKRYAQEIQTPEYGVGLEGVIQGRADRLVGILNGVDYTVWSPELDTLIAAKYSAQNLAGKVACKKDLLAAFQLPPENLARPLVGIVSRLTDQKGFDLIAEMAIDLLKENLSLVVLGSGEPKYEKFFQGLAAQYPQRVGVKIAYDNALAHKIEAGSDMFLMPSRYEPCGLNQIYSLRYGTVPVVRATGGLDDTIVEFDPAKGQGTGFRFEPYNGKAMLQTVRQALRVFGDKRAWQTLQANGMAKDFSWKTSATAYVALYEAAGRSRIPRAAVTSN